MGDPIKLLAEIEEKLAKAKSEKKSKPRTRAEVNKENGTKSNGPTSPEGKARASANSLKHGYYADIEKLNPHDSASYIQLAGQLRSALHPDGPAEEHLIKELAMLSARLKRLEAAEFALLLGNIEGTPPKEPAQNAKGRASAKAKPDPLLNEERALTSRATSAHPPSSAAPPEHAR